MIQAASGPVHARGLAVPGPLWATILSLTLMVLSAPGGATAQGEDGGDACDWGRKRELGGHTFLTPSFVDSALVLSYLGGRVGIEFESQLNISIEGIEPLDIDRIYIGEAIDAGVALFDRLQLFVHLVGIAGTSTDAESFFVRGSEYRLSATFGAMLKLFEIDATNTQVSIRGFVTPETGDVLTLLPLASALIESEFETLGEVLAARRGELLVTPYSAFRWGGGVAVAQPLTPLFSAQASARVTFESASVEPFDLPNGARRTLDWSSITPELGIALTGDADPVGVPLAVMLEYQISFSDREVEQTGLNDSDTWHTLAGGVYYTGRSDLQTGVVLYTVIDAEPLLTRTTQDFVRTTDSADITGVRAVMRYFW
jgi:hypothetical protein